MASVTWPTRSSATLGVYSGRWTCHHDNPCAQHATSSILFLSVLCQKTTPPAQTQAQALSPPRFYTPRTRFMTWISRHTPRAFPASRFFRLDEEIWFSMSPTTSQSSTEKPMSIGNTASSATPIALNNEQTKNSDNWSRITSTTLSTWWGTSRCSRHQALTWLSPWRTSIDSQTPQNTRVFGPTYGRT